MDHYIASFNDYSSSAASYRRSVKELTMRNKIQKKTPSMSAQRAYQWFKRSCWLLAAFIGATLTLFMLGLPSYPVAIIAAFTFAEMTRRIMAEHYPDISYRWCDIFRHAIKDRKNIHKK